MWTVYLLPAPVTTCSSCPTTDEPPLWRRSCCTLSRPMLVSSCHDCPQPKTHCKLVSMVCFECQMSRQQYWPAAVWATQCGESCYHLKGCTSMQAVLWSHHDTPWGSKSLTSECDLSTFTYKVHCAWRISGDCEVLKDKEISRVKVLQDSTLILFDKPGLCYRSSFEA